VRLEVRILHNQTSVLKYDEREEERHHNGRGVGLPLRKYCYFIIGIEIEG